MRWSQGWKEKLLDMRELWSRILPGSLPDLFPYTVLQDTPQIRMTPDRKHCDTHNLVEPSKWLGAGGLCSRRSTGEKADRQPASGPRPGTGRKHEGRARLTLHTSAPHGRGPRGAPCRIRVQTKVPHIYAGYLSTMTTLNHRLSEPGNLTGFTLSPKKWTMGVSWLAQDHEGGRSQR